MPVASLSSDITRIISLFVSTINNLTVPNIIRFPYPLPGKLKMVATPPHPNQKVIGYQQVQGQLSLTKKLGSKCFQNWCVDNRKGMKSCNKLHLYSCICIFYCRSEVDHLFTPFDSSVVQPTWVRRGDRHDIE